MHAQAILIPLSFPPPTDFNPTKSYHTNTSPSIVTQNARTQRHPTQYGRVKQGPAPSARKRASSPTERVLKSLTSPSQQKRLHHLTSQRHTIRNDGPIKP